MNATITTDRPHYHPGEEIRGTVTWTLPQAVHNAELRLFWHTQGKGTRDADTVEIQRLELPQTEDTRNFSFPAPAFPYSFSGKLISLVWGLELVLDPGGSKAIELVIAPAGKEIDLHATPPAPSDPKASESPWMPIS